LIFKNIDEKLVTSGNEFEFQGHHTNQAYYKLSPSLSPISWRWFPPACSLAIFAPHPTWSEFPYVLFSSTTTNWASPIAAGYMNFAIPCAYRAWLVTWRGFANIY
jgi:hypothetical protein